MEFKVEKGGLDLGTPQPNPNEEIFYFVDFSKLKNVNDLMKVLASMGFGVSNKNPYFPEIEEFLDLNRPVKMK